MSSKNGEWLSQRKSRANNYVKISSLRIDFLKVARFRKPERKVETKQLILGLGAVDGGAGCCVFSQCRTRTLCPVNQYFLSKLNLSDRPSKSSRIPRVPGNMCPLFLLCFKAPLPLLSVATFSCLWGRMQLGRLRQLKAGIRRDIPDSTHPLFLPLL